MKRIMSLMAVLLLGFVLAGCVSIADEEDDLDCEKTPFLLECIEQNDTCPDGQEMVNGICQDIVDNTVDCDENPDHETCVEVVECTLPEVNINGVCQVPVITGPGLVDVLDVLPDEEITVTFWHVLGQDKENVLNEYIAEFELLYPNVTIDASSQEGYTQIRDKTVLAIASEQTPTMLIGYPDHVALYLSAGAVIPLDDFIYDENHGVDLTDFIDSYVEENAQYAGGLMFSFPYSKSTEIMFYNKDKFAANNIEIPTDRVLTWAELDTMAETMVGSGPDQCEFLINYDSSSNFFINNVRMWQGGYTNSAGDILVEDANTKAMLTYVKQRFDDNTFAMPIAWNQQYGSANFLAGDACMTVGSTAGLSYNIPKDGQFEMGIAPIPQYDLDSLSVTQQGPNMAIMSDTTDGERLAAWLFLKFLTDAEHTADWAMRTGYLPVRTSAYELPDIQAFLNNPDPDYKYESMALQAAYIQRNYNDYDPAFSGFVTSANARDVVGLAMDTIFVGTATVEEAISDILSELGVN